MIDFDAHYTVEGYDGVAWYLKGYDFETYYNEALGDFESHYDYDFVQAVMVGDDRVQIVDVNSLKKIDDEDSICSCGQLNCCT